MAPLFAKQEREGESSDESHHPARAERVHSTAGFVDPGFSGRLTLELTNIANLPIMLYYDMPISHSLLGAVVWAFIASLAARAARLPWRPAALIGVAVFSHFVLDVPMHTPDLPLAWRGTPKIGLGLWNHRAVSLALELIALGAGLLLYVRGRKPLRARFWIFAVTLAALTLSTPFMPPPAGPAAFAVQALFAYLVLALWAGWVDLERIS